MITASVSNIDLFRVWRESEDLDVQWLIDKIQKREQTEAMKVGEAFHKALEVASMGEVEYIEGMGYRFEFLNDCEIELAPLREISLSKMYGDVLVRGRVDATNGLVVTDYKSTAQFDADRLMGGYQWRFYLDMSGAIRFRWNVFVLKETDDPKIYLITESHPLDQVRYPDLERDCRDLAWDYAEFAHRYLPETTVGVLAADNAQEATV